ncbi:hypothetical protein FISHEDRAFT_73659 [Fistulina hepatica ATCC 64428]|uniref:Cell morphogenesis protein n=1 Tax=Fistulina hepatica ATCC 64428 TaxID=1128425 RepID=A0A0D7AC96_9AGAR|nr:hypothetical protein FISHEDRAFT_73659 [Fistulina hepatica ATCC 64428]
MSTDGFQITIPDLPDDNDFGSAPTPFGRGHGFGFGSSFGGSESPVTTPIAERGERSYFQSHVRGNSAASVDSLGSMNFNVSRSSPFMHTPQHSFGTPSFPKKTSFVSIRNAFKGGKSNTGDLPPVPPLDFQTPILKNPFNRSTSSLSYTTKLVRPSTPASAETRFRGTPTPKRGHSHAKSQHSHTGSIFHLSDAGSDYNFSSSPPPVPRMPDAFGHVSRSETPDFEDDKVIMDPKTPADYGLHAVFMRFVAAAESKIDAFLRHPLDNEPLLPDFMGPAIDEDFDDILRSLGKIAQKHAKSVIDSVMRWRRSQNENVGSEIIKFHLNQHAIVPKIVRMHDVPGLLNERKSLASIYIVCRALVAILQSIAAVKDALGETWGQDLLDTTFDQFKNPDLKLLTQSANHRSNAKLYTTILGLFANIRHAPFLLLNMTVAKTSFGNVSKDLDMKYEILLRGLMQIQIKVWPIETFEEGAEFMQSLSILFANTHGHRLKSAFAETLVHLLHPIGKTAQAETNIQEWAKAIENIYPKAKDMMAKPRYWSVAFPLAITSLCVAPREYFLKNWVPCLEVILSKIKEKGNRASVMNGVLRLLWTYIYRCQESPSTTTSKLDSFMKFHFPGNRPAVFPHDDNLAPFIYIVHFILSRHPEFGREFCLDLMQEATSANQKGSGAALPFERLTIAVQAILRSLYAMEREAGTPTWPSTCDFTVFPPSSDYPSSSAYLTPALRNKPTLQQFLDRAGQTIANYAASCNKTVGHMSVFDEQWICSRYHPAYEERQNYVICSGSDGNSFAYPRDLAASIGALQTCFQSWPRLLHPSLSVANAVEMVLRGVIHVEPTLAEAARPALKRFMEDDNNALAVLAEYYRFMFSPGRVVCEGSSMKVSLLVESNQLLTLWMEVVDPWVRHLIQLSPDAVLGEDGGSLRERCSELEKAALFLLTHETRSICTTGVKVMRILGLLLSHLYPEPPSPSDPTASMLPFAEAMAGKTTVPTAYLTGFEEQLDEAERTRLEQWHQSKRTDVLLRLADSSNEKDRQIWRFVYPAFLQHCVSAMGSLPTAFREAIGAAAGRYHASMSQLAGLSNARTPVGTSPRVTQSAERDEAKAFKEHRKSIDQWYLWIKILCATAPFSETSRPALTQLGGRGEHMRAPSDALNFERERLSTTRGLFRYLTPFLDSDYTLFRDNAALCISSFPSTAYPQLLEDLSLLAGRQFYDDTRTKPLPTMIMDSSLHPSTPRPVHDETRFKLSSVLTSDRARRQERLHSAVAHIYFLTAPFLQHQRAAGRQAVLANVLKFVRNTQMYLTHPEAQENPALHRLRRYFCGIVERLFDGLATLQDSHRFIPTHMHLTLYRLCEEWCQLGHQQEVVKQTLIKMQRSAPSLNQFQYETTLLSYAAVGALASLCQKALYPPEMSSAASPSDRPSNEDVKPLTPQNVLDRIDAILASEHKQTIARGKKALRSLLSHRPVDPELLSDVLKRAVVPHKDTEGSHGRFLAVISDAVNSADDHGFAFAQLVCLGLANLCHASHSIRQTAFSILQSAHHQSSGLIPMSQIEPLVGSLASMTYVNAHKLVSHFLSGEHPGQAKNILIELATWLPYFPPSSHGSMPLLLLQSLEFWIPNIQLMKEDGSGLSQDGQDVLFHLLSLTRRYSETHTEQILALWTKLVDSPFQANGRATSLFLLEQSPKVGSTVFMSCAANIIAALCHTPIGRQIFEHLCSFLVPENMLPMLDHKTAVPDVHDMALWANLDELFCEEDVPRMTLGLAQYAWLYLSDVALERYWELQPQLPVLLHVVTTHIDHRSQFIRRRAHHLLFQLLRSWIPGYDGLPDRMDQPNFAELKAWVSRFEDEVKLKYWKEDESGPDVEPKMRWLCAKILDILEPLCLSLAEKWGSLALVWGTSCSIRATAYRSLQIFRAISPRVKKNDFAILLGRLTNTMAAPDTGMHTFTCETILTLNSIAKFDELDKAIVPQLFWFACAGLTTTVEREFAQVLDLLEILLLRLNFDDPASLDLLLSQKPINWTGEASLHESLLTGLRSAATSDRTMKLLQSLTRIRDGSLIDPSEGRVRDLYTSVLPWCLNAMTGKNRDADLIQFAENISALAELEGRQSIAKIMTSFARSHFRTRDDFLQQSVACLREHYGRHNWTEIVTLLLSLVLNKQQWLRVSAMEILKVLFHQREARNPAELLGSDLLMPLLRLLETDLAPQALDVLEEPMIMSGGPAAKHVLRMSLHTGTMFKEFESVTFFGVPEESGWCIAKAETRRETCRANLMAVFDTCHYQGRPSQVDFQPEMEALALSIPPSEEDDAIDDEIGDLVHDLYDLSTFFQAHSSRSRTAPGAIGTKFVGRRVEALAAGILAKTTASDAVADAPQTPFLDVFHVGKGNEQQGDDDSDSDSSDEDDDDGDAFIFDSLSFCRTPSSRVH